MATSLQTRRLRLRDWRDDDLPAFAALNADPAVMEYFAATLTRVESDALATRIRAGLAQRAFGLWAVEVPGIAPFIGFVGLSVPGFSAPFTPCIEIGWRLAAAYWGHGYATEAAQEALRYAFEDLRLDEVVAFTAVQNSRSRRVMKRLGMHRDESGDFDHPGAPTGHPLSRHVLYRLARPAKRTPRLR